MKYKSTFSLLQDGYVITRSFGVEIIELMSDEYFLYDEDKHIIIYCVKNGPHISCGPHQIMLTGDTDFMCIRFEKVGSIEKPIYALKALTQKNCHLIGKHIIIDYDSLNSTFNIDNKEILYNEQLTEKLNKMSENLKTINLGEIDLSKYGGDKFAVFRKYDCKCIYDDDPFEKDKNYKFFIIPDEEENTYCVESPAGTRMYTDYEWFTEYFIDITMPEEKKELSDTDVVITDNTEDKSPIETNIYR